MILLIGLGNPGKKYEDTRHNIGFRVLDALAKEIKTDFKMSEKFNSEIAESTLTFPGEKKHAKVLLVKPQTYMNNSGDAVAKVVNFYKLRTEDQVIIIHDDLDILLGKIRIRLNGSSAGQKGIQSIIDKLGTDKFTRFRIGIKPEGGPASPNGVSGKQPIPAEVFVLEKFRSEEKTIIKNIIKDTVNLLIESIDRGVVNTSV